MSGFIEDLSPEQGAALETLRAAVSDVPELADKDDRYLLRWLRARKFHTAKAEDMLRKHIETRQKYKLDSILTDYKPNEVLEKYFPGGMMGEDREGHPVWYDHFNYDFKGLHYSVRMDEVLLLSLYRAELALKMCATASAEKGRPIETVTFVVSYEKLSIQRHYYWPGIQMIRKTLALLEANYPETIKQTFFINLPAIFPLCFNLLKPYINENTRAKIFVLGSNYREVLLKHICPDQLPAAFGGTRCEPDPDCTKYTLSTEILGLWWQRSAGLILKFKSL
jgi:metal transporter CNNM